MNHQDTKKSSKTSLPSDECFLLLGRSCRTVSRDVLDNCKDDKQDACPTRKPSGNVRPICNESIVSLVPLHVGTYVPRCSCRLTMRRVAPPARPAVRPRAGKAVYETHN